MYHDSAGARVCETPAGGVSLLPPLCVASSNCGMYASRAPQPFLVSAPFQLRAASRRKGSFPPMGG
jgi:hypothetical protein